jgi:hypothetical protein
MSRVVTLFLLIVLLAACAGPTATQPTPEPQSTGVPATSPPSASPPPIMNVTVTAAARETPTTPTARATAVPATLAPAEPPATPEPTVAPTSAPTAATPAPVQPGTQVPVTTLDLQAQTRALLPSAAGDLGRAGEWNRYTIVATIDPQARTIAGHERLEYTNRDGAALDRVYFHLYPNLPDFAGRLDITALTVDGQTVEVAYETKRYLLRVDLPGPLAPGAATTIEFDFTTRAPANASQDYYGAFNLDPGILALASSYPIVAIVRGGNWDIGWPDGRGDFVNSETSLYDVTLTAPAGWKLATTGTLVDGRLDAGQQVARIVSAPQRDFMIVATQFSQASADVDGTRINSYFRPEHEAGGQAALQAAVNALRAFNKRYGTYPLAELDIVEVAASTFLGVEYPGLIMLQDRLYDGNGNPELTAAHEVGHQWWYSLVGNNVQTEAWLDEALASYSEVVYQEEVRGPEAAERSLDGFRERYRRALAEGRDEPVDQPNTAFTGNYVAIVYGKAVLFFQALREQIGEEAFDRFLHAHYEQHRYGYISGNDLLATAEGACACQLDELYASWITTVAPVQIP